MKAMLSLQKLLFDNISRKKTVSHASTPVLNYRDYEHMFLLFHTIFMQWIRNLVLKGLKPGN